MRTISILRTALLVACFSLAFGCQKKTEFRGSNQEPNVATQANKGQDEKKVTRAYRDSFAVALRLIPDFPSGWTPADPDAPAWYPGTGAGNATHMGNATTYFNTHTMRVNGTVMVYHARVGMFYTTQIAPFGMNPTDEITVVNYDGKGNSIWYKIAPAGLTSSHLDATHVIMEGTMYIVNGTGKFAGATGETKFYAAFDQASWDNASKSFTEASTWQNGWIRY